MKIPFKVKIISEEHNGAISIRFWQLQNELRTKPLLKLVCQFELKMKRASHIDVSLLIFAMQPIIFTKKNHFVTYFSLKNGVYNFYTEII